MPYGTTNIFHDQVTCGELAHNLVEPGVTRKRTDLYEDGAVMVLDAGALTLSVSPAFPTICFLMNNRIGYGAYKYIDEGSTLSGELMAKLQTDDAIPLIGRAIIEDRETNSKWNCEISARFEGKA